MTFKSRECYENTDIAPITIAENADIKTVRQSNYIAKILAGYIHLNRSVYGDLYRLPINL